MTAPDPGSTGWADEETMASKLDGVPWVRPHAIAINGMGSAGTDFGFATDLCYALDEEVWAHNIVDYSASAFPMGPSVTEGIEKVVALALSMPDAHKALFGYSEGSLVMNHVWRDECLSLAGRLHDQYARGLILCVVLFGDPMRCPGRADGNVVCGVPIPPPHDGVTTGGISGSGDLTPEQTIEGVVFSCSHEGDVYASAPVGDDPWHNISGVGHDMEIIFAVVQNFNGQNVFGIMTEVLKVLDVGTGGLSMYSIIGLMKDAITGVIDGLMNVPVTGATQASHVAYLVQAVMTFGMFVLDGLTPHTNYGPMVGPMADKVNEIGRQYSSV